MHGKKDLGGGGSSGGSYGDDNLSNEYIAHIPRELLVDIPEEILEHAAECCIYRVPNHLRKVNEEAYTPQFISIGPFHHGKPELAFMEKQKMRYERTFRDRITDEKWEQLEAYVRDNVVSISNCYADIPIFKNANFITMVLLDGVFIIEYLLRKFLKVRNDYMVNKPWLKRGIKIDLHLLENQLPYFVLERLYKLAFMTSEDFTNPYPDFLTLCCKYSTRTKQTSHILKGAKIQHFTDLIRHNLVPNLKPKSKGFIGNLPSAVKLHESHLKFKAVEDDSKYLLDIKFEKHNRLIPCLKRDELHIPHIYIFDYTEYYFRNIMALEQCHYPLETHFCNYINLLDKLINTEKDVDLLVENKILTCYMVTRAAAADMINKLSQNMVPSKSCFLECVDDLNKHYDNCWSVYFYNLWRGATTITAIMLLALTVLQSICAVIELF